MALLAMVLWFGHEMVWSGKVPFFRDLGQYFYPLRFMLAESFKAGALPLWDRHMGMGFPLLADFQSAAFYPPHLLFLVFPFFTAIRVLYLFHYMVAAAGGYLLCRRWNYPPYLALVGALLFTLGGAVVSLTNLLNHFQAAVWLPAVLLMGERLLLTQSWKNFLLLTLILVLQFLAGSPEFYVLSMALLCLDGLRIRAIERNISYQRVFCLFAAANVLVMGLAMVQILPTAELYLESRGRNPIVYSEAVQWSLHPLRLLNLFFLDTGVDTTLPSGVRLFFAPKIPLFISHYLGAISLVGVSLWFFYGTRKEKGVLLTLIIISLVLAFGRYTPVYPFLYQHIPFFGVIRFPEKFFFLIYCLLLFITLRGLYEFLESDYSYGKRPLIIVSSIPVLMITFYLFLCFETVSLVRLIAWATQSPPSPSTIRSASGILFSLERQMALMLGIFLIVALWKYGKIRTSLFQALIVGLVFFDLTSAHRPHQYFLDADIVYNSPRVIAAPSSERNRIFYYPPNSNLHPSYFSMRGQPSFQKVAGLVFSNLIPNTGVFHGFDYMQEIDAFGRLPYGAFLDFANKLSPEKRFRLLGRLNVQYIIALQPLTHEGVTLVRHFPEHPSWLYRIDRITPRAYIASKVIAERDPRKTLERLSSEEFDPLNEVILAGPLSVPAKKNIQANAEIISYTNHQVRIRASLNSPGVLVLADSFYPGWHVYVDGEE
ncbi:MAG: hypothetical protein IH796_00080 [Deltaproteobacteria bacterium]|nr:hypothetical protein [Deltaproteobacteria bacterium]